MTSGPRKLHTFRIDEDLPVLFDDLEKRTRLDVIATQVQQVVRQRPIGTAMTYAMHLPLV